MADERRIVIELKLSDGSDASSDEENKEDDLTDILQIAQHPIRALEKATLGKNKILYYAYQQSKQIIKNAALYNLQLYFNLTENYKSEQDLQNTLSVISHVSEAWSLTLGGAIMGAKAGPAGAVAGAAIGLTFSGINTVFNAFKEWNQQSIQLNTMNIQSSYQKVRLGLIDDGRGTQN